jgi:RNA polymerase sigma-70 factor, ECF subfamily
MGRVDVKEGPAVITDTWPNLRADTSNGEVDLDRDRELVTNAQCGDKASFDLLYECYSARLQRYCLRRLKDPHEAEDVMQEAFLRAWRALPTFGGERRFFPWISVIASNLCTDVLRRRQRFGPVQMADPSENDLGTTTSAEDFALASVDLDLAGQAYARLSDRHRRVLDLRERSGLSYQDIAVREGIRITTVETLIWRARQAFKREFEALSGSDGTLAGIPVAVLGIGLMRRMLRATARTAAKVPARLAGLGPQAVIASVGGAVAAAALVVASTSGVAHPAHAPARAETTAAAPGSATMPLPESPGGTYRAQRGTGDEAATRSGVARNEDSRANPEAYDPAPSGRSGLEGDVSRSSAPAGRDEHSDQTTDGNAVGDLVKQVRKATSGASGVVGDLGQVVSGLENAVGSTLENALGAAEHGLQNAENEVGTASSGVSKMLSGDVNNVVAALKNSKPLGPLGRLGQVVSSVTSGSPGSGASGAGAGSSATSADRGTPSADRSTPARPVGTLGGQANGLLGNLFG